jgi:hypothetical protein
MTNKFEKLIEYIINDEDQKARDLFHDIVVEKSRDIYESIMDEEQMDEMVHGAPVHDELEELAGQTDMEEISMEDDEEGEEEFNIAGDAEQDGDADGEFPADGEEAEHEEIEDKVMNIDAKLDELLAKFDEIMGGNEHGEEMPDHEPAMGMDHEDESTMFEADDCDDEDEEEKDNEKESKGNPFAKKDDKKKTESRKLSTSEMMREYVDKIQDMNLTGDTEGTPVGATGKKTAVNTKSGSVGPGADFGGTAVKATGPDSNQDGTSPTRASNEYTKGEGQIKSGNRNVPGGKAGKPESTGEEYSKEHPADGTAVGNDGKLSQNTKSVQKQNTGKK